MRLLSTDASSEAHGPSTLASGPFDPRDRAFFGAPLPRQRLQSLRPFVEQIIASTGITHSQSKLSCIAHLLPRAMGFAQPTAEEEALIAFLSPARESLKEPATRPAAVPERQATG